MIGKLKALIILLIVVGGIYVAWEMVPPYIAHYQFQDELDDIVRHNSYTNRSDDDVRQTVIKKANEMGIPLKDEQVTITRPSQGLGISVQYRIHVDMLLHPVDLDFIAKSINIRNI